MDFLDILREKAFLGREFLTWLWFKSDQTGGQIDGADGKTVEVVFLDRMTFDLPDAVAPQTATFKGEQSELREGLACLREGKKIEEAKFSLKSGENEFVMTIKGTWFSFGGFKTPAVMPSTESSDNEDPEAAFLEKVYLVEEGMDAVDSLFGQFLKLRISSDWETELAQLSLWVQENTQDASGA
jgi:hypothetical protein